MTHDFELREGKKDNKKTQKYEKNRSGVHNVFGMSIGDAKAVFFSSE